MNKDQIEHKVNENGWKNINKTHLIPFKDDLCLNAPYWIEWAKQNQKFLVAAMRDGYEADLVYIKSIRLSEKMTKKLQHLPY